MTLSHSSNLLNSSSALPLWKKLIYGSGDLGRASFNTLRQIFYAIFLTDVVGLDPRLASVAALVSIIWDAVNDPIIGSLSDNVQTRWGRRRPFLMLFSVPFLLAFLMLWWAPPWKTQGMLMLHVTLAYMVSDTLQTLVTIPYLALTPELAPEYDQRTSLTSIRMFFNLIASLVTAVAAPSILDASVNAGFSLQQGYLTIAAIFGGIAVIPFLLIFLTLREKPWDNTNISEQISLRRTIALLWQNTPFKYATGIYVLNWISFDLVALMLPFYILYWVSQGDLLAKISLLGLKLSIESAVFGIMLLTATLTIPMWNWAAHKFSKRLAYIAGMIFWIMVQIMIMFIQPGQMGFIMLLAFFAGIGVSTAHIMPDAIFPDVIDWDEFKTHTRREGMYYGAINFIRKLASALAIFGALQILGWVGYQSPPKNAEIFFQSSNTILTIRLMTGPVAVLFLASAVWFAWGYPLSRERQSRILRALQRRTGKKPPGRQ
jgi:GPH family glycoside/pentoside/hexuronide:cation symporter